MTTLNKNNSAVKRILQEAKELANDPSSDYSAAPLEDDIFEWHCTLRGPQGTDYEGGLYHFRILLPAEYPFRPPSIIMLTPNGRFELNTQICISFTNYHEELWQPAWGVRTAIIGLQGFFPLKGQAAVGVGSVEYPPNERKRLAGLSREWVCPHCKETNLALLPDPTLTDDQDMLPDPPVTSTAEISSLPTNAPDESQKFEAELPTFPDTLNPLTTPASRLNTDHDRSNRPSTNSETVTRVEASPESHRSDHSRSSHNPSSIQKPPVLLDTAICILFVLLFAIICRRMV